ncbi:hypothetical protein BH20VER3_BH20VER3_15020 [soil metagenome]
MRRWPIFMNHLSLLEAALRCAALTQLGIALLNLSLVRLLDWKADLARLPLLLREVFQVHLIFISITVATFALLTWRFAREIATAVEPLAVWLAVAIGLFWAVRALMQWTTYSHEHWRGDHARTALHWLLFLGYGAMAGIYLTAALGRRA